MTARQPKPRTDAERSRARYQRAAATLPPITLDADHAAALARLLARTGETRAALVRRLIREADAPVDRPNCGPERILRTGD